MAAFEKLMKIDRDTITFTLKNTCHEYSNALLRAIKSYVPTVAFRADMTETGSTTDVIVYKNSTPMSNEMLADRIGLLPIHVTNVDGWEKERYVFKLHVKNETSEIRHVFASDFEVLEQRPGEETRVKVPNTKFFHPDPVSHQTCLIATLKPQVEGQEPEEIHIEAYASIGTGSNHIRFSPICVAAHSYTRDEDQGRIMEKWIEWLTEHKKVDPKDLEKDQELKKALEREFRSMEIHRCYKMNEKGEPYSFDCKIESRGVLPPTDCVYRGCLALAELCEKYVQMADGDLPPNVTIKPAEGRLQGFDIIFEHENYTLGTILQTWVDQNVIDVDGEITCAGFNIPHPLRDEGRFRVGVKEDAYDETILRSILANAFRSLSDMYRDWSIRWNKLVEEEGVLTPRGRDDGDEPLPMWEAYSKGKAARAAESVQMTKK